MRIAMHDGSGSSDPPTHNPALAGARQVINRRSFIGTTGGALIAGRISVQKGMVPSMLDHILLGCNDLERGIEFVEKHLGVRAQLGGIHPGRGTQNALLSLGGRRYLEIIAPDPEQKSTIRHARILELKEPRLIGWAASAADLTGLSARLRSAGIAFRGPEHGSRNRPDGRVLNWQTLTLADDKSGILPFFIQWGAGSPHPSSDAPKGCSLVSFEAAVPDPGKSIRLVTLLGLDLSLVPGDTAQLRATLSGKAAALDITS